MPTYADSLALIRARRQSAAQGAGAPQRVAAAVADAGAPGQAPQPNGGPPSLPSQDPQAGMTFGRFAAENSLGGMPAPVRNFAGAVLERTVEPIARATGMLGPETEVTPSGSNGGLISKGLDVMQSATAPFMAPVIGGASLAQASMEALGLDRDAARHLTNIGEFAVGTGAMLSAARAAGKAKALRQAKIPEAAENFVTGIQQAATAGANVAMRAGEEIAAAGQTAHTVAAADTARQAARGAEINKNLAAAQNEALHSLPRATQGGEFLASERVGMDVQRTARQHFTQVKQHFKQTFNELEELGAREAPRVAVNSPGHQALREAATAAEEMGIALPPRVRGVLTAAQAGQDVATKDVLLARSILGKLVKYGRTAGDPDGAAAARQAAALKGKLTSALDVTFPEHIAAPWAQAQAQYRNTYTQPWRSIRTLLSDRTSSQAAFDNVFNMKNPHVMRVLTEQLGETIRPKLRIGFIEKLASMSQDFSDPNALTQMQAAVAHFEPFLVSHNILKGDDIAALKLLFRDPMQIPAVMEKATELVRNAPMMMPQPRQGAHLSVTQRAIARVYDRLGTTPYQYGGAPLSFSYLAGIPARKAIPFIILASLGKDAIHVMRTLVATPRGPLAQKGAYLLGRQLSNAFRVMNSTVTYHPQDAEDFFGPEHDADYPD